MNQVRKAVIQALAVVALGTIVAFAHNEVSVNGIDPFRHVAEVPVIEEPGEEVRGGVRIVDLEEMLVARDRGANVIDARNRSEYEAGHIPGALLLDYYDMGRYLDQVLPMIDPSSETIIYCYGPDCDDAELLARELFALGFTNLIVYRGGFEDWLASGGAVESGGRKR